ncbi:MAG TPA: hypothetical protein VFR78_05110 [Pyrinomonadaceae bacterium]|nr:hypothetical protein [Pyrinomonadaceae bacterium]
MAMIEGIKTFGSFVDEQPVATIGPSGSVSRSARYTQAYIVRRERTCPEGKEDCGIKGFSVFYWLPFNGKVQSKHTEHVAVKDLINETRYYLTVAGRRVAVSAADYKRLRKGQHVSLEMTIADDLARIKD